MINIQFIINYNILLFSSIPTVHSQLTVEFRVLCSTSIDWHPNNDTTVY